MKLARRDLWTFLCLRVLVLVVSALVPVGTASTAWAFKVDTHIWVAQQVLNDLADDGKLTFRVGNRVVTVPVEAVVRDAILRNREVFRMGNIGPDALPGIFEGQMTIHPGSDFKAWGTGHWLRHVVERASSEEELAFAFGFLGHAAADVFAHSYVNGYAGDVYVLTDGEVHVERRHFLLEGYIASRMPALVDETGQGLGAPAGLVMNDGRLAIPVGFLREAFIDDEEAAAQFGANGSGHLLAVHELNGTLRHLIREGGPLDQLHILSQQLAIEYYTGLEVNEKQLREFNELHQKVRDLENSAIDEAQKLDQEIRAKVQTNLRKVHQGVNDALGQAEKALQKLVKLQGEKQRIERDIAKAEDDLRHLIDPPCRNIDTGVCNFKCPSVRIFGGRIEEPGCAHARSSCRRAGRHLKWVCELHASRPGLKELVRVKQAAENKVSGDLLDAMGAFKDAVAKVQNAVEAYYVAEGVVLHASIDLAQRFHKDVNPVRGIFSAWLEDNTAAMEAYFVSNGTAIYNSMTHGDIMAPLKAWVSCWAPALLGIPSQVPQAGCAVRGAYGEIKGALEALEKLAVVNTPILNEVRKLKEEIEKALMAAVSAELYRFGERVTGVDIEHLAEVLGTTPTKALLDAEFMMVPGSKALLAIERISDRVDAEMGLVNGVFDVSVYAVVYDAVVLAKLALLDAEGLNKVAGRKVYSGTGLGNSNLMPGLASSIDGDYAWMAESPPYARASAAHAGPNRYGYAEGWPLWRELDLRKKVFRRMFVGPLSPGLHTPEELGPPPGFGEVLPTDYPYDPSKTCGFPTYPRAAGTKPCE